MLGFRKYWIHKNQSGALRDLRRDPHLARDLGLMPLPREPKLPPTHW